MFLYIGTVSKCNRTKWTKVKQLKILFYYTRTNETRQIKIYEANKTIFFLKYTKKTKKKHTHKTKITEKYRDTAQTLTLNFWYQVPCRNSNGYPIRSFIRPNVLFSINHLFIFLIQYLYFNSCTCIPDIMYKYVRVCGVWDVYTRVLWYIFWMAWYKTVLRCCVHFSVAFSKPKERENIAWTSYYMFKQLFHSLRWLARWLLCASTQKYFLILENDIFLNCNWMLCLFICTCVSFHNLFVSGWFCYRN